jgi:hypothetical protein
MLAADLEKSVRFLKRAIALGELEKSDAKRCLEALKRGEGTDAAELAETLGMFTGSARLRVVKATKAKQKKRKKKKRKQKKLVPSDSDSSTERALLSSDASSSEGAALESDAQAVTQRAPIANTALSQSDDDHQAAEPEAAAPTSSRPRRPARNVALIYAAAACSGLLFGSAAVVVGGLGQDDPAVAHVDPVVIVETPAAEEQDAPAFSDEDLAIRRPTPKPGRTVHSASPRAPEEPTPPQPAETEKKEEKKKAAAAPKKLVKAVAKKAKGEVLPASAKTTKKRATRAKGETTRARPVAKKAEVVKPQTLLLWALFQAWDRELKAKVHELTGEIAALGDDLPEAHAGRGFGSFLDGAYPKAIEELLLAESVTGVRGRLALARAYSNLGDHKNAVQKLSDKDKKTPVGRRIVKLADGPFRAKYPHAAAVLEAITPDGHYRVVSDLGLTRAYLSELEAKLAAATPKARARLVGQAKKKHRGLAELTDTMDKAYKAYDKLFNIDRKGEVVPTVFVFSQRALFDGYSKELEVGATEHTLGYYVPYHRVLVFYDMSKPGVKKKKGERLLSQNTLEVLLHETFHQWIHLYARAPHWFNEGMAEYFGISEMTRKELHYGLVPRRLPSRLSNIRDALRGQTTAPLALEELLVASPATFMQPGQAAINYAQAWSFCHFLGSSKKGRKLLRGYFKAIRANKSRQAAFDEVFGRLDMGALQKDWEAYVFSL